MRPPLVLVSLGTFLLTPAALSEVRPLTMFYAAHPLTSSVAEAAFFLGWGVLAAGVIALLRARLTPRQTPALRIEGMPRRLALAGWALLGAGLWALPQALVFLAGIGLIHRLGCGLTDANDVCGLGAGLGVLFGCLLAALGGLGGGGLLLVARRRAARRGGVQGTSHDTSPTS